VITQQVDDIAHMMKHTDIIFNGEIIIDLNHDVIYHDQHIIAQIQLHLVL
jgi:hypothetical protein